MTITLEAPGNEFSQVTRHRSRLTKSKKSIANKAFETAHNTAHVTLTRNLPEPCHAPEKIQSPHISGDLIADIATLSKMCLRRRYSAEANSHRNMLSRRKTREAVIHAAFLDFADFLAHVGPTPAYGATLDRIDNNDPEYGPGKVRWADTRTQNGNKGDSLIFYYARTGDTYTTSRLAKLQGVSAATVRKRFERGWSDDEIIEGHRSISAPNVTAVSTKAFAAKPTFLSDIPQVKTAAQIDFERNAEYFRLYREEHGEEALMASLSVLREELGPYAAGITEETYERRFRGIWPTYRPHVIFANVCPEHRALIERIDPEYVAKAQSNDLRRKIMLETI